jgi:CheY-like chemotaxis protein
MTRILIADDEPHIRKLVSFTLGNHGYEVLQATDGGEAVSLAKEHLPDLVLMDVMMPVMTGFDAVRMLREDPATAAIPVVMLSAKSQRAEVQEGMDCGATEYICKPFTPKDLVQRVGEILGATEKGTVS